MSLLAISSVIVGILYLPLIINLFGFEAYYINLFDFSSWLNYLLYIFIGFLFYRYVIRKDFKFLQAIRNFSMSFEDANYALILYISIFVSVMFFVI